MSKAQREPTLADVARVAGVSYTTVSRVLNNRGYLSQDTKDKVAAAIEELNYRPNQVARALHGKSTNTIGLIVPTVALPFFGELVVGIENSLAEHGYRILVCNSMGQAERERQYLSLLVGHRVDGIISGAHNENLAEYSTVRMPLVTVDRDLAPNIPNVRARNEEGGAIATKHLLEVGCQRPALLTSRSGSHNLREAGYRKALANAGIEPLIVTVDFHTDDSIRQSLLENKLDSVRSEIDGVFATDDLSAASVIEWAFQRGIDIPKDFKVVGFDGTNALMRALPGLTTVAQPISAIAESAVELLLGQINANAEGRDIFGDDPVPAVELPVELVKGRTT